MKLHILGTRGSIPSPSQKGLDGEKFVTEEFGGNTTCYMVETDNKKKHIIDAGTGIRGLGIHLLKNGKAEDLNLYFTHTHWDHIQGFPFFAPAYIKGCKVDMFGEAKVKGDLIEAIHESDPIQIQAALKIMKVEGDGIKGVLEQQQAFRNFPAPVSVMQGLGDFYDLIPGGKIYEDKCIIVETQSVNHPGGCVSYKFTEKDSGKKIIIATDFEPDNNGLDDDLIRWWKKADIVVADAQYERGSKENPFMETWGHSDYQTDIALATKAGVRSLVLTHHEPKMDDAYHSRLEEAAKVSAELLPDKLEVMLAREGTTYEI